MARQRENIEDTQLQKILHNHEDWLESLGKNGELADLNYKNLSTHNLSFCDLRRAMLNRANLCGTRLHATDLRGADLRGAHFDSNTYFEHARLQGAIFDHTTEFNGVDLRQAEVEPADFKHVDLLTVDRDKLPSSLQKLRDMQYETLKCTNTKGTSDRGGITQEEVDGMIAEHKAWVGNRNAGRRARSVWTDFGYCKLSSETLANAIFIRSDFSSADLSYSDCRGVDFSSAIFGKDSKLDGTDLRGCVFDRRTDFTGADLRETKVNVADFRKGNVDLLGVDPDKLPKELRGLRKEQEELPMAASISAFELEFILGRHEHWLTSADKQGECAQLDRVNLSGVDLSRRNLTRANLCRAQLGWANLSDTNLFEADLSGAVFSEKTVFAGTDLRGAIFDEKTDFTGTDLRQAKVDVDDFRNGNVDLSYVARDKLPPTLQPFWDEQQRSPKAKPPEKKILWSSSEEKKTRGKNGGRKFGGGRGGDYTGRE